MCGPHRWSALDEQRVTCRFESCPSLLNYAIGIDPDVTRPSVACVGEDLSVVAVDCIKVSIPKGVVKLDRLAYTFSAILDYLDSDQGPARWGVSPDFLVVEGQSIWGSNDATPQSILSLGIVGGMCMGAFSSSFPMAQRYYPAPDSWKGGVVKHVHQARTCTKLGWKYVKKGKSDKTKYCQAVNPVIRYPQSTFNPGDWKHGMDAAGLAMYAFDQQAKDSRRALRTAKAAALS